MTSFILARAFMFAPATRLHLDIESGAGTDGGGGG